MKMMVNVLLVSYVIKVLVKLTGIMDMNINLVTILVIVLMVNIVTLKFVKKLFMMDILMIVV